MTASDNVYRNAIIDKAEKEVEVQKGEGEAEAPDLASLPAAYREQSRGLRKRFELQKKLKAKQAANATEEETAEAKKLADEKSAAAAEEAIRKIELANKEKDAPVEPKKVVKLAGKSHVTTEGSMSAKDNTRLQSMVGAGKAGKMKAYSKLDGQKSVISEAELKADEVLAFTACNNCEFVVDTTCTKIFVERCTNFVLRLNGKVVTQTIEIDACEKMNLLVCTKMGTLQVERCKMMNIVVEAKEYFTGCENYMIWAGCFMLRLQVVEDVMSCDFGLTQKLDPTINIERTQFKVWINALGKLSCDKIVRLKNGFPTTKREDDEHLRREEGKLDEIAKRMGVTVHKKEDLVGARIKPNAPCHCGSGQKYKKCCRDGKTRLVGEKAEAPICQPVSAPPAPQ